MMDKLPLVSFITITYNGFNDTCELIESLQTHVKSVSYEIIVVDNASKNNEARTIGDKYPFVTAIRSEKNLGFSGGNNLGIRQARGEYIFLINNDTYVIDDKLSQLVDRLKANKNIAALSPKLKYAEPPFLVQFAGFTPLTSVTLRNSTIGSGESDETLYNTALPTPYLHGAALMIKREVIDRVGMMPEIFFLYYEELDWCTHITKAGYELWYDPAWCVYHKESRSTGNESPLKICYMTRNRLLYAWRNLEFPNKYLSIIYLILVANAKSVLTYLLKGKTNLAAAVLKGTSGFFSLKNKKEQIKL